MTQFNRSGSPIFRETPRVEVKEMNELILRTEGYLYPKITIPNVKTFKVEVLSKFHPVFLSQGKKKRQFAPIFERVPYRNKRINRYLKHQFRRLNENVPNYELYWCIGEHLLNRSNSYLVLLTHNVDKRLRIKRRSASLWKNLEEYLKLDLHEYRYKRLPIPKDATQPERGLRHLRKYTSMRRWRARAIRFQSLSIFRIALPNHKLPLRTIWITKAKELLWNE